MKMERFRKTMALILSLVLSLSVLVGPLAGCSQTTTSENTGDDTTTEAEGDGTRTVTLSDGYVVEGIPENVERIAALFGPSYEKLYVLGAEDKIVVCSSFHQTGWAWSHLIYEYVDSEEMVAIANASSSLNVEDLLEYDIDVCFYWNTSDVLKALENVGIAAVPYTSSTGIDSVKATLYSYAEILGTDEAMAIADRYAEYFDETLAEVQAVVSQIPEEERKTVYPAYASVDVFSTYGQDSVVVAAVEAAGGIPVTAEVEGSSSIEIDKEQLLEWNPDVIFLDHVAAANLSSITDSVMEDEDLANVTAVQNSEVYAVPIGVFYWDAGIQIILLVKWLAVNIYPEYFPDVDMVEVLKDFYEEFYRYELTDEQAEGILANGLPS